MSTDTTSEQQPAHTDHLAEVIGDQEGLKIHRKKVIRHTNLFLHTVDKFILLLRVYPAGHPLVEEFAEHLITQLKEIFTLESSLYVRVKAMELLTEWNEPCFTRDESERENFLWYVPSVDGLISFTIDEKVSLKEIVAFLTIINKASMGSLPFDDDTITMLWECDLQHIDVHAVEGYLDMNENAVFGAMNETEAKVTVMHAAIEPSGESNQKLHAIFAGVENSLEVDIFTSMQYTSKELVPSFQMPPEMLADAFRVDQSWSHDLVEEWVSGDDLEQRLIESLLSIVRTSLGTKEADTAIETITQITEHMLDSEDYATATRVLQMIGERAHLFDADEVNPVTELLAIITQPMRIEALLFQAQKYIAQRDDLLKLLALFDHNQVQRQILSILSTPGKEVRALDALLDLLFQSTNKENSRQWLAPEYTSRALFFERLLPGFKTRPIAHFEIAPRLLAMAMKHDTVAVRKQVLQLADPGWCTSLIVEQFIKPCMSDEDPEVRKLAIDAVRRLDPKSFEKWLAEAIEVEALSFRAPGEVTFLLELYIAQDERHREALRKLLDTRGWFNARRRSLARTVAIVLLKSGDAPTRELIARHAGSMLTSPALREEYEGLLARHPEKEAVALTEDAHVKETP